MATAPALHEKYFLLAGLYVELRDFTSAERSLKNAIWADCTTHWAYVGLADLYSDQSVPMLFDLDKAIINIEKANSLTQGKDPWILIKLTSILYAKKEYSEALKYAKKSYESEKSDLAADLINKLNRELSSH